MPTTKEKFPEKNLRDQPQKKADFGFIAGLPDSS
jgi:hypothetical protein